MYVAGTGNGNGIFGSAHAVITDSVVEAFASGIWVDVGSLVRGCTTTGNSDYGIRAGAGSLVTANIASGSFAGIWALEACTVIGNNVSANQYGITAFTGSTLLDNTVRENSVIGIFFAGGPSGYARNVLSFNNGADTNTQVSAGGIEIGTNICGTDTVCP